MNKELFPLIFFLCIVGIIFGFYKIFNLLTKLAKGHAKTINNLKSEGKKK